MLISELTQKIKIISLLNGNPEINIAYIQSDSRKLEEDDIFCLYENFGEKSTEYIQDALKKKVKTILIRKNSQYLTEAKSFSNIIISQQDPMQVHGYFASLLKDEPSKKCKIIAYSKRYILPRK